MVRSHPINPDVRLEKEATTLSNAGNEVVILGWGRYGSKVKAQEIRRNYYIHRFQLQAPLGYKIFFFLPLWWIYVSIWLLKEKWDVVHAADLDCLIPSLIISKFLSRPIIYDIFDFYSDQIAFSPTIRKIVESIDCYFMKHVDEIILVDSSRIHQIKQGNYKNVSIIYNSPPKELADKLRTSNQSENFKIFFAGGLSLDRDISSIIKACGDITDIFFEIAGYGPRVAELLNICKTNSRVQFLGEINYDTVILKSFQADLLFAFYDPKVPNNFYASPNKLFEAMMCGKPILVNSGTTMAKIVSEENCGLVVPYGDIPSIREAVLKIKNDKHFQEKLGKNGKRAFERTFNWNIMEKRLIKIYQRILTR